MGERISYTDEPAPPAFPHVQTVEAILGLAFPNDFDSRQVLWELPEDRCSVWAKAHEIVWDAVKQQLGEASSRVNEEVSLTKEQREHIAGLEDIHFMRSLVAVANNVVEAESRDHGVVAQGADPASTPRAQFQLGVKDKLAIHLQTVPNSLKYLPDKSLREQFQDKMAVVAPTGSGKTVIEATILQMAGVGKPISPLDDRVSRAVVVTPFEQLVNQYAGRAGDDTFRRFLGKATTISRVFGREKNFQGHVRITTPESFSLLDPLEHTLVVVDEGHHGMAPQLFERLQKVGTRVLLFTATPAYSRIRDLRKFFNYIEEGTLRGFVEQGILNPVRLLTYQFESQPEALAAALAKRYIEQDRKVVVYGQKGTKEQPALQARLVAASINEWFGEKIASSVGAHNPNSDEDEELFAAGGLRLLCACQRLREGWNEDVDVGIFIGPHFSLLDLAQKLGRIMRPGKYVSEAIELLPAINNAAIPFATLWQLFGLERVVAGLVIGPGLNLDLVRNPNPLHGFQPRNSRSVLEGYPPVVALPVPLLENIVINEPLRHIQFGRSGLRIEPSPGFKSASALAEQYGISVPMLQHLLDEQKFAYQGIWPSGQDSKDYERWYEPDAADYLEANPPARLAEQTELTALGVGKLYGVGRSAVLRIAAELGLTPTERAYAGGEGRYFNHDQIEAIGAEIEKIPLAHVDDVPIHKLVKELNHEFVTTYCQNPTNNVTLVEKRLNPEVHGTTGQFQHVTAEEAEQIRNAFYVIADSNYVSLQQVMTQTGVRWETVKANLTDGAKEALRMLRPGPYAQLQWYLPKAFARELTRRLNNAKLPPHQVTKSLIEQRVKAKKPAITAFLRKTGFKAEVKKIGASKNSCFSWAALVAAEERFGRELGHRPVKPEMLVRGWEDADPDRWQYTQELQRRYIDPQLLVAPPAVPAQVRETPPISFQEPGMPPAAAPQPRKLNERDLRKAVAASRPLVLPEPKRAAAPSPPPVRPPNKPSQAPATLIPADFVNLKEYLTNEGAPCEQRLAQRLSRQHGLTDGKKDSTGVLWATRASAAKLSDIVRSHKIAESDMSSAEQLARPLAHRGVKAVHIEHLAPQLTNILAQHEVIRRTRLPDGTAGELRIHYKKFFADTIKQVLNKIGQEEFLLTKLLRFGRLK